MRVHVYAHRNSRELVEQAGGTFVDLFAKHSLEEADSKSTLTGCRYVSFAGLYADEILREVRELGPSIVVYDTFAVIGRVAGMALGIPYVNVCNGHNIDPARYVAEMSRATRVAVSDRCRRAVELLRERYGLEDASPFSYLYGRSPFLNVYCEPAAWLPETDRPLFEPVVFYGSLPAIEELEAEGPAGPSLFGGASGRLRVYASFGTVVWHYWPRETLEALATVSRFLGGLENASCLISVGGSEAAAPAVPQLTRPNVSARRFVDQWEALREADVFITHNGLSSTHEAIFHGVPMLSYPFFADQPAMTALCRSLGLAVPLSEEARGPLTERDLEAAFDELALSSESLRANLARAREWELETIRDRGSVHDRIVGLIGQAGAGRPA